MSTVIIGAGHAGVQAAASLREEGYDEPILLIEQDDRIPYQRPPLSKDYLADLEEPEPLPLRPESFYKENAIDLRLSTSVTAIHPNEHIVELNSGERLGYGKLILACGAEARRAQCEGHDLLGVKYLRTLTDAEELHASMRSSPRSITVVGAGFIGLEFASAAAKAGIAVTVIDFAARPMQRVLSEQTSSFFSDWHEQAGVVLRFEEGLAEFEGIDGQLTAVIGTSGTRYECDLAVVGLGVVPVNSIAAPEELFATAGIPVDQYLRTSFPDIFAIGDAALYPSARYETDLRIESVPNATEMARTVARTIAVEPTTYDPAHWFWSTQSSAKLQIAGVARNVDEIAERGDRAAGQFSVFLFSGGRLVAVESVNSPADHVMSRKLLDAGMVVTPEQVADTNVSLRELLNDR